MPYVQILLVGNRIGRLQRLCDALGSAGYRVTVRRAGPSPTFILACSTPDLLILEIGPGFGPLDPWKRAIDSFRWRRSVSVLAITGKSLEPEELKSLDAITDLGTVTGRVSIPDLLNRVDRWSGLAGASSLAS